MRRSPRSPNHSPLCRAANPRRRRPDHPQDFRKPPRPDISDHIFPNNRERSARPAELQAHCSNPFEAHPLRPSPNQAAPKRTYRASSGAPSGMGLNRGKIQRPPPRGQPLGAFPHIRQPSARANSRRTSPNAAIPIVHAARRRAADHQCGAAQCRGHPLYTHASSRSRSFQPNRTMDRIIEPSVTASSSRPAHEPTQRS